MHATIKTLLVGSFLSLTIQQSNAEVFPPNFEMPAPIWGGDQTLIAWGDCVPVPVYPMNMPPANYPIGNSGGNMGFSQPIPMPAIIPYPSQNEPLGLLPPPSPFFNTVPSIQPQVPVTQVPTNCESDGKLQELQQRYDLASSASKQKIAELSQALKDTQNQIADSQNIISIGTKENTVLKEKISKFENQISDFKTAQAEKATIDAKEKSTTEDLKKKLNDLDLVNINLKTQLSSAESNLESQAKIITTLKQSEKKLLLLKNAYKERNDETAELKQQLEKHNNDYKSLQAQLSTIEGEASNQAIKLTALGQSEVELTALKSTYKERSDENTKLKESLANLDNENKTLKTQLAEAQTESASVLLKLNILGQSSAELTALKSVYKEKNDENTLLKQQLTNLDKEKSKIQTLFDSNQTAVTLKAAQDSEIIEGLKKNLKDVEDANKSLIGQLEVASNNTSAQTRKITALSQSSSELAALKSDYQARHNENAALKQQLSDLDKEKSSIQTLFDAKQNSITLKAMQDNQAIEGLKKTLKDAKDANKSLKDQLDLASNDASEQTKKITALSQSSNELTALQSAYKQRNDENSVLKSKLVTLTSTEASIQESANACKVALENIQEKFEKSEDERKTLSEKIATLENTTSEQTSKIKALMITTSELDALKGAYKDLTSKEDELTTKLEEATADADSDGVIDSKDQCPSSPSGQEVNIEGCPNIADADKDGIADANDLCPASEAGSEVNGFGCAETENITLKGVNFATGSSKLTANSLPIINAAASTIKQSPNINIEIAGYTDNQGLAYINKRLSKRRANSVMIELIKQGVDANRLTANGYGEKEPVADNKTETGRADNRRVELKLSN